MEQDTVWIRKIASGDREAFEEFFQAYKYRVFGYVFRLLNDPFQSEEVTSDVLAEVWKSASRFSERSKVSTWVLGIARHKVIDELRRRKAPELELDKVRHYAVPDESPERAALRKDEDAQLRAAMEQLSQEHREVLELAFFQNCSLEEVAGIVNCPVATVKTRMFYARKKMRQILEGGERGPS